MGRVKLPMELIENEAARRRTFKRRIKGSKKKAYELATLCDTDVLLVVLGPTGVAETWPEDLSEFNRIMARYMNTKQDDRKRFMLKNEAKELHQSDDVLPNQTKSMKNESPSLSNQLVIADRIPHVPPISYGFPPSYCSQAGSNSGGQGSTSNAPCADLSPTANGGGQLGDASGMQLQYVDPPAVGEFTKLLLDDQFLDLDDDNKWM